MVVILSYFHNIIGPDILYQTKNTSGYSADEISGILRLLDTADEGFFTHNLPSLRTANRYFTIPSPWARGRKEMLMVSVILQEQDPDLAYLEETLDRFVDRVLSLPEAYKACAWRNPPEGEEEAVRAKKFELEKLVDELANEIGVTRVRTWGMVVPFDTLQTRGRVGVPPNLIRDFADLAGEDCAYCFFVYRKRPKGIRIDLVPVHSETVLKLTVVFSDISPALLRSISGVLEEMNAEVVFTSGICLDEDNCVYEAYLEAEGINYEELVSRIVNQKFVESVDVKRVHLLTIGPKNAPPSECDAPGGDVE
ncbi:MAG: hypothetical protein Kow0069_32910 [Promethearchaeota archaeon]